MEEADDSRNSSLRILSFLDGLSVADNGTVTTLSVADKVTQFVLIDNTCAISLCIVLS